MKKKKQILYYSMALMMLLVLSLPSCIFDNYPQEDGQINVMLTGSNTRGGNIFDENGDAVIEKIRIFVFSGNYAEANKLFVSGADDFTNPFTVDVVTGPKSVYVVANETEALGAILSGVTTITELEKEMADVISSPLEVPLVMSGKINNVTVATGSNNSVEVELKRLAAKIALNIKKDTESVVVINKISLLSNTGKSVLWEGESITGDQSYWDLTQGTEFTLSDENQQALEAYVYENLGNSSDNNTNATKLVMEGTYAGMGVNYSVYVNEHIEEADATGNSGEPSSSIVTGDTDYYNIKRNYHYNITATIKSYGITILTEVKEWTPVERTAFAGYGYTVEVNGTDVTVRNGLEDCDPHKVELKIIAAGLTFVGGDEDGEIEAVFNDYTAGASSTFTLSQEPTGSNYLEVWYNGVRVHIF